jgi:acyl-CoA synthetase (AMP-forming)/AMP-acid ligase II
MALTIARRADSIARRGRVNGQTEENCLMPLEAPQWTTVTPVADLLTRAEALAPDRIAVAVPGDRWTYAELLDGATTVARGLLALGIDRGRNVGILAPNGIRFLEAFFAIEMIGAVAVPLNVRHKATELRYIVKHADLEAVLTTTTMDEHVDLGGVLSDAFPAIKVSVDPGSLSITEVPRLRCVVLMDGGAKPGLVSRAQLEQLAEATGTTTVERARRAVRVRDLAVILYTSGTTANPKGCMLTHEALTRGPVSRSVTRFSSGSDPEVFWNPGPLFHIGALSPYICCVGATGTLLTDVYFDAGRALGLMREFGVTSGWPWFPLLTSAVLEHPEFDPAIFKDMRFLGQIGPRTLFEQIRETLPWVELFKSSGMTEAAGSFGLSTPDETFEERVECQGEPIMGVEVKIADPETDAELARGAIGHLLLRGFCMIDGYYGEPELTAQTIDGDGWVRTGDYYSHLPSGKLVFHGRIKDMLRVGGENVAPVELEQFICCHPAVQAAAVVGRPDERLDEVPVAFVERKPGAELEPDQVIAFCVGQIASYKVPREVYFVDADEWPMSATKIDKGALRTWVVAATASRR